MSRIYDALKKLEAERGGGGTNGHGNGHGNGNGHRNGKRKGFPWFFARNGGTAGSPATKLSFQLGPSAEEAFQRLGTNLLVGPGTAADRPRLLGVTASMHGEGTTTTAAVFASILVRRRGGRVAVVEANLRTPSFPTVFGTTGEVGFADLVLGREPIARVAQAVEVANLFAISGGQVPGAPSALFDSPGMRSALEQLRAEFDFVVVDLPPVNVYSDASILGPHLDGTLLVIEADRTRVPDVERTRRSLERVGARVMGSVLNRKRSYIPAFLEELL